MITSGVRWCRSSKCPLLSCPLPSCPRRPISSVRWERRNRGEVSCGWHHPGGAKDSRGQQSGHALCAAADGNNAQTAQHLSGVMQTDPHQ